MRTDPVLPSADLNDTVDFYTSLGFELGYDDREGDGYVILGMDGAFIHFFYHDSLDATGSDAGCYLHVEDAQALHTRWAALGLGPEDLPRLTAVEDQEWGKREFALVDPDGNLIRVGQDLPPAAG
jgi:catechol 2,3-dioxygenase-like lactoylglutathione lyase family enzyme